MVSAEVSLKKAIHGALPPTFASPLLQLALESFYLRCLAPSSPHLTRAHLDSELMKAGSRDWAAAAATACANRPLLRALGHECERDSLEVHTECARACASGGCHPDREWVCIGMSARYACGPFRARTYFSSDELLVLTTRFSLLELLILRYRFPQSVRHPCVPIKGDSS
ncbi:hypothetical protein K438DRAFT_2031937 [Mycena galopus ATCC 62051]|nr:hypothetical protein K438DRAFT_2031937 [Mycena galopus ATCC 62051]